MGEGSVRESGAFVIERLGAKGDGVATLDGETVYVPFALAGEQWRRSDDGYHRITDSAERAEPVCRHFMQCGGCLAQHISPGLYRDWKRGLVVEAFRHRGIDADVKETVVVDARSRRRAFLGVERRGADVILGFREEG